MLNKLKTGLTTALAATLCLASVSATAAEWRFKDYDTTGGVLPSAPIVYQEFDSNGLPTGRVVSGYSAQAEGLKGFAEMSLKGTWVSDVYPNQEYAKLYADGAYTGRVYATGRDGEDLVTYRDVDFMWEASAPYKIYSIKQARLTINGVTQWFGTVEKNYPVQYSGKNASVAVQRVAYGFGDYEVTGANKVSLVPERIKQGYMDTKAYSEIRGIEADKLAPQVVAPTPIEVSRDAGFLIPRTYDLKLVGPSFDDNGNQIAGGTVLYGTKYPTPANFNVPNLLTTLKDNITDEIYYCDITWTEGGFERAKPYKLYEYLTVDGVVMDGSKIGENLYKPCIFRYTGATANLPHRTVVAGVDAKGEVVLKTQVSFDNGKTFVDEGDVFGTGIFPNVEYRVEKNVIPGEKTVTPVYVFNYNGVTYNMFEVNGEWFVEEWGNNTVYTNAPHFFLEPYVPGV